MLKKAGIIVATAAAGLLAVSPLAFAGDKDDHDNGGGHHGHKKVEIEDVNNIDDSNRGLINVSDNNVAVPVNVCDNQVGNVLAIQGDLIADLSGALTILGVARADDNSTNTIDKSCHADADAGDVTKQKIDD